MMRRHLLTLFALFTGLAAINAPAHASALDTLVSDARAVARFSDCAASENCACVVQAEKRVARAPKPEKQPDRIWRPFGLRPPVVFGSERALE